MRHWPAKHCIANKAGATAQPTSVDSILRLHPDGGSCHRRDAASWNRATIQSIAPPMKPPLNARRSPPQVCRTPTFRRARQKRKRPVQAPLRYPVPMPHAGSAPAARTPRRPAERLGRCFPSERPCNRASLAAKANNMFRFGAHERCPRCRGNVGSRQSRPDLITTPVQSLSRPGGGSTSPPPPCAGQKKSPALRPGFSAVPGERGPGLQVEFSTCPVTSL